MDDESAVDEEEEVEVDEDERGGRAGIEFCLKNDEMGRIVDPMLAPTKSLLLPTDEMRPWLWGRALLW